MGFLKPKQAKSTSDNQAYGALNTAYSPTIAQGTGATNFLSALLTGNGDTAGAGAAFDKYKTMAGYAPALRDMQAGITGGGAAKGLLSSGATSRALLKGGAELDQGMFGNFLQQLSGLSGLGMQAGNLVSGAGQRSSSTGGGPSTAGTIGSAVGGIASLFPGGGLVKGIGKIFSDRRTKRDITHLSTFEDGLGLYAFRYLGDDEMRVGVMADEVAAIRPWALGPVVGGFSTVNYGAL